MLGFKTLIKLLKFQNRGIRLSKKDSGGIRRIVFNESLETSATTLQHIVLKPPPNSPASATLVPLVKPLVLKQVARKGMSRGEGNFTVLGKHESTLNLLKPPPNTPASASLVPLIQPLVLNSHSNLKESTELTASLEDSNETPDTKAVFKCTDIPAAEKQVQSSTSIVETVNFQEAVIEISRLFLSVLLISCRILYQAPKLEMVFCFLKSLQNFDKLNHINFRV